MELKITQNISYASSRSNKVHYTLKNIPEVMELLASEIEVIDELRSETYSLEYANFKRTWLLYDEAETGKMSTDETENCVRKMLSDVQIESFSPYKLDNMHVISDQLKMIKMRAKLANLNNCAVLSLSRAATSLCWYYYT